VDTMHSDVLNAIRPQHDPALFGPCCTFNCEGDLESDVTSDATMRAASQMIHDAAAGQPDIAMLTAAIVQQGPL
jgi:hypothetical protein